MVTTPPSVGAVLEAPAAVPATTTLIIWSIKAEYEKVFYTIVGATNGDKWFPSCLSDTLGIETFAWRDIESFWSLTNSSPSECTDVVGTWEEVSTKGSD